MRNGLINAFAGASALTVLTDTLDDEAARDAADITLEEDLSPGAPPNSYFITIPFDSNGDGETDASITGRATFSEPPPDTPALGFSGVLDVTVDLGPVGEITALINFEFGLLGIQVWGAVTLMDLGADTGVDLTVPESAPMRLRVEPDGFDPDDNLCYGDLDGEMQVDVGGPTGLYSALWSFSFGSLTVMTSDRMHTPDDAEPGAEPNALPDGSIMLPSCTEPALEDWEGQFILNWSCVPEESGQSRLTFEVIGPDTIQASDEHPIGSGESIDFTLTADPGNPHVLRGFFQETESSGTYREDVIFVLAPSRNGWTQNNIYEYLDGPLMGSGGVCGGRGSRVP